MRMREVSEPSFALQKKSIPMHFRGEIGDTQTIRHIARYHGYQLYQLYLTEPLSKEKIHIIFYQSCVPTSGCVVNVNSQ